MAQLALLASGIYHVCTRGNNREDIFLAEHDRRRFLGLLEVRVSPRADIFAYCLLPNHLHLLLRFADITIAGRTPVPPSQCLSNLLNAYARSFNQDHGRTGALFQRPFRRVLIQNQAQLAHVVVYIHTNPERHGLTPDFRQWRFSSYATLLASGKTALVRDEVLAWFGGRAGFEAAHLPTTLEAMDRTMLLESQTDAPPDRC